MKGRIIIITGALFPRGDANANYIENIALAFLSIGYQPFVIAKTMHTENSCILEEKEYRGIKYYLYNEFGRSRIQKHLNANVLCGESVKKILSNELQLNNDLVLVYSHNAFFINVFYHFCVSQNCKIAMCITEDLQKTQTGLLGVLRFKFTKRFVIGKSGKVLPISEKLKKYYDKKGCRTLLLPPLVDPYEYEYYRERQKGRINLIYSGNGRGKDSYKIMLDVLKGLDDKKRSCIKMNFTGLSKQKIMQLSGYSEEELDELGEMVKVHPWMEYSELVDLYRRMDFLFIPRIDSNVTRANFPSKVPELLAYGVCPIITDVGDCTKYLRDGENAIIVKECTSQAFTRALMRILNFSEEERDELSSNARKTAEEIFYYKHWGTKLLGFMLEEGECK